MKGSREGTKPSGKGNGTPKSPNRFYPLPKSMASLVSSPGDFFNFGLYFNKWLWARKQESSVKYEFQSGGLGKEVLDRHKAAKSGLPLFLKRIHSELECVCKAFERLGYKREIFDVKLETPLIVGLGNSHPTERGFTFHWTLGVPYLPAESVKGVVRLAYLVNEATSDSDFFKHWEEEDEVFGERMKDLFGRAEAKGLATRGKVVFLDAFPTSVPDLTLEITTCHYSEYYSGARGPTEDQNPNPLPFLAVASEAELRFICLVSEEVSSQEKEQLLGAFKAALREYGFGAKTALGHGRFSLPEER